MTEVSPNELFVGWLKEWWDIERERNTKAQIVYKKAYQSMKGCETIFEHASQAEQLNGVGPKICRRLEDAHKQYCHDNGLPLPEKPGRRGPAGVTRPVTTETTEEPPKKKTKVVREYVPQMRSGPYAILKTLGQLEQHSSQALTKSELCDRAQPFCDASFTVPADATKFYTAFKSMDTLLTKELVYVRGHPVKKYALTDEGWRVALKMQNTEAGRITHGLQKSNKAPAAHINTAEKSTGSDLGLGAVRSNIKDAINGITDILDLSDSDVDVPRPDPVERDSIILATRQVRQHQDYSYEEPCTKPIIIRAGTFEVQMLLDNREVRTTRDRDYIANELKNKYNVVPQVRPLPLGDILWVAKLKADSAANLHHQNTGDQGEGSAEIVLEHIVERKRLDDLIASIKDGRFHEQKFRLKKSGLKNIAYLVETISISSERLELYGQSIESSIAQMQMVDNIFVKQTAKMDDSIAYLAKMTKLLKAKYEQSDIYVLPSRSLDVSKHWHNVEALRLASPSCVFGFTFSAFCSLCDKSDSLTLRDQFLRFLMCIHGVTGEKAISIQRVWPTPRALIDAYAELGVDSEARKNMISDELGMLIDRKRVTKTLSARIAEVWS